MARSKYAQRDDDTHQRDAEHPVSGYGHGNASLQFGRTNTNSPVLAPTPTSLSTGICSGSRRVRTSSSTMRFAFEYSSLVVISCPSDERGRSLSALRSARVNTDRLRDP